MATIRARHTTIQFASSITVSASSNMADIFTASTPTTVANAKNVTISEPEGGVENVDMIGVDTNGFQNSELDEKPFGLATISGTLLMDGDEVMESFMYGPAAVAGPSGYTRWQIGQGSRTTCAILVKINDSTDALNCVLNLAVITKLGDRKLSADGHWEQDFNASCLTKNYYTEFKD